jgi:hypothetical protein
MFVCIRYGTFYHIYGNGDGGNGDGSDFHIKWKQFEYK